MAFGQTVIGFLNTIGQIIMEVGLFGPQFLFKAKVIYLEMAFHMAVF